MGVDQSLDPFVQAVRGNADAGRYFRHAITAIPDLLDGFSLKFRGKSLRTHKLPPMLKG